NISVGKESKLTIREGDYIKISVQDHGEGISEKQIQKIFDPYFTTKKTGSGLGLSSTYSIIKNHNGHIDVESEVGKGTTFTVYLPASRENLPDRQLKTSETIKGSGKILFMDDEKSIRETVFKMLTYMGYDVESAKDGVEAIKLYEKSRDNGKPFDVVIMDLTIRGGMGGSETIQKLIEIDPDVKAIVSSGYSTDEIMSNHDKFGFCGVISKPYDIQKLSELLSKIMNGKGTE
ncbi:unnamed protein product, partial [marine sediment metagenome]